MGDEPDADLAKRAVRLLARRDRSRAEMQRYLARYCADAQRVRCLLDDLQARGWLSEARLADEVIRARRSRASTLRIKQEMARRGIGVDVIEQFTSGLEGGDFAAALTLWQRKFKAPPADRAERERQLRYMLTRGFSHAIALKILRTGGASDEFDDGE